MENFKELRAKKPNLYRLACELSKFDDPYAVFELLLAQAGPILKKEANHDER